MAQRRPPRLFARIPEPTRTGFLLAIAGLPLLVGGLVIAAQNLTGHRSAPEWERWAGYGAIAYGFVITYAARTRVRNRPPF